MLLNQAIKIQYKMEHSDVFRFVVLAVVVVNFFGVVILPPLLYLLGGPDIAQFHPYVELIWSALLVAILVYYSKCAHASHVRYFDKKVPAFLIAVYFLTILVIFVLKTVGFPIVYRVATELASYDTEMIRMHIWAPITYLLYIWQLYIVHTLCRKKLMNESST